MLKNATIESCDATLATARTSHKELANRVGYAFNMVSKKFKKLRVGGYFSLENYSVEVHKELPWRW